jgi:hypothetical protein
MAIVYTSATLGVSSMDIGAETDLTVTLTNSPAGATWGSCVVNGAAFPLADYDPALHQIWKARLKGYRIHKCTAASVYICMTDTTGSAAFAGVAPTLTVTWTSSNYFPQPGYWLKRKLQDNWDTAVYTPLPEIYQVRELRSLIDLDVKRGYISIEEQETTSTDRGRGDYHDATYPLEIVVEVQGIGDPNAKERQKLMVAEVIRIVGVYYRNIPEPEFDMITALDNGRSEDDEHAGIYKWVWHIALKSPLRGRTLTPSSLP